MTMNPPPPIPATYGSVTPRVAATATAASTAFPPLRRISMPTRVASASTLATAPPVPVATACFGSGVAARRASAPVATSIAHRAAATTIQTRPRTRLRYPERPEWKPDGNAHGRSTSNVLLAEDRGREPRCARDAVRG